MNTIHNAIERRNFVQLSLLVAQDIGIDTQDKIGFTPLMKACHDPNKANAREMVRLLLKHKANINILDRLLMNVLQHASLSKNELVIELLLQEGDYDPTHRDLKGNSALHIAAATGNLACVELLIDHLKSFQLKPDLRNDAGYTPMLVACCQGHLEIARYLHEVAGASLNARDAKHDRTPIEWLREKLVIPDKMDPFNPEETYIRKEDVIEEPEEEELFTTNIYVFLKNTPELCLQEAGERMVKRLNKKFPDAAQSSASLRMNISPKKLSQRLPDRQLDRPQVENDGMLTPQRPKTGMYSARRTSRNGISPRSSHDDITNYSNQDARFISSPRKSDFMTSKSAGKVRIKEGYSPRQANTTSLLNSFMTEEGVYPRHQYSRYVRPLAGSVWRQKEKWRSPHDMKPAMTIDDLSGLRSAESTNELIQTETDSNLRTMMEQLVEQFHLNGNQEIDGRPSTAPRTSRKRTKSVRSVFSNKTC